MSRIRSVKPEFWTSDQVVECSTTARLLFIGLWNFVDDAGRHAASPRRLKMEVFPADPFTLEEMDGWITELIEQRLVIEYEAQGQRYWQVTGWSRNQKIDKPTVRFPGPDAEGSTVVRGCLDDYSPSARRIVVEASPPERNGREGKGEEGSDETGRDDQIDSCFSLDWTPEFCEATRAAANRMFRGRLTPKTPEDRDFLLKVAALLVVGEVAEHAVADAVAGVQRRDPPPDKPVAFFWSVLAENLGQAGQRLQRLLARVSVPESIGGRPRPREPATV